MGNYYTKTTEAVNETSSEDIQKNEITERGDISEDERPDDHHDEELTATFRVNYNEVLNDIERLGLEKQKTKG